MTKLATNLIKSFLTDRKQRVIINDNISNDKNVRYGAPQGSILAPLLFIIYTSDFHRYLGHFTPHLYADDTQLYCTSNIEHLQNIVGLLSEEIVTLIHISKNHCLSINPNKSSVIVFGTARTSPESHRWHFNICGWTGTAIQG